MMSAAFMSVPCWRAVHCLNLVHVVCKGAAGGACLGMVMCQLVLDASQQSIFSHQTPHVLLFCLCAAGCGC
jgi:hypothetical protein